MLTFYIASEFTLKCNVKVTLTTICGIEQHTNLIINTHFPPPMCHKRTEKPRKASCRLSACSANQSVQQSHMPGRTVNSIVYLPSISLKYFSLLFKYQKAVS